MLNTDWLIIGSLVLLILKILPYLKGFQGGRPAKRKKPEEKKKGKEYINVERYVRCIDNFEY